MSSGGSLPTPDDENADKSEASSTAPLEARSLIARGLVWNSAFQVFLAVVNFVAMIALVRLLSPTEYGRAAAVSGVFALINCFNCRACMAQALQLSARETPDWDAHFRAGMYIQLGLTALCNAVAGVTWMFPAYRPMAPVLHVASIGLLFDVPSQLATVRLRRAMDFRNLRLANSAAVLLTAVSSIALAMMGAGAYALIVSSNVLHGVPFGLYLLFVDRWKPPARWWAWPDWRAYRTSLQFGAQQSGTAVLAATRGMLETVVIPPMLGYEALGLLNRAQVLFTTTVGRVTTLVVDTVYPMLPRSASEPTQFARHATIFVQTMLLFSIPGAVFVGLVGPELSRLLYGSTWIAADPLIWPGTLFAWGVAAVLVFSTTILARNRLRGAFLASVVTALLCLPAIGVSTLGGGVEAYAWALAAGQIVAVLVVGQWAGKDLQDGWLRRAVVPPVVAAAAGAAALLTAKSWLAAHAPLFALLIAAAIFGVVVLLVLRLLFPRDLHEVLLRLPASGRLMRLLWMA